MSYVQRPIVLTKRATFCASHRLHAPGLSDDENKKIFGKCNHENGHGHNYTLEVSVKGVPDPQTGMVINITELKKYMFEEVIDHLDHKNIDKDVPEFKHITSSAENIAIYVWDKLEPKLSGLLYKVKLWETKDNIVTYKGDKM